MVRVDLRRALDMLPRYFTHTPDSKRREAWVPNGSLVMTNANKAPKDIIKVMAKIVAQTEAWGYRWPERWVDVSGNNVFVLHQSLKAKHLMYLFKRDFAWNKWPRKRLPFYISYKGKLLIWNGTHRMTLGRLANRKVRALLLVVDDYIKWKKKNPDCDPKNRVVIKPKKKVVLKLKKKVVRRGNH